MQRAGRTSSARLWLRWISQQESLSVGGLDSAGGSQRGPGGPGGQGDDACRSVSDDAHAEYGMGTLDPLPCLPELPVFGRLLVVPDSEMLLACRDSGLAAAQKGREEGALMTLRGGAGRACGAAAALHFCHVERQARRDDPRASHYVLVMLQR